MTFRDNNMLMHNLRSAAKMTRVGMKPPVVVAAFQAEGIPMTLALAEALAAPGVLEGLSSKPITHDVVERNIQSHTILQAALGAGAPEAPPAGRGSQAARRAKAEVPA